MSLLRTLVAALVCAAAVITADAKRPAKPIYAFGYANCLGDSTVYVSAIQPLEGARLTRKKSMLIGREQYAQQMEQYMRTTDGKPYTCAIFFAKSRKKAEKQFLSLRRQCARQKEKMVEISAGTFAFTALATETAEP